MGVITTADEKSDKIKQQAIAIEKDIYSIRDDWGYEDFSESYVDDLESLFNALRLFNRKYNLRR